MKYKYKDNVYDFLARFKFKVGKQWLPAILYRGSDGQTWGREADDFIEKFENLGNPIPANPSEPLFTRQQVEGFAEWVDNDHTQVEPNKWSSFSPDRDRYYTTSELLDEYLKSLNK